MSTRVEVLYSGGAVDNFVLRGQSMGGLENKSLKYYNHELPNISWIGIRDHKHNFMPYYFTVLTYSREANLDEQFKISFPAIPPLVEKRDDEDKIFRFGFSDGKIILRNGNVFDEIKEIRVENLLADGSFRWLDRSRIDKSWGGFDLDAWTMVASDDSRLSLMK